MKKIIVIVGILIAVVVIGKIGLRIYTKSFSPQETETFDKNGIHLSITYCRPYKKGREIFGGLVPYGEVWRTGANEATVFKSNTELIINNKHLPAGEYSVFTIPGEEQWDVIFNSEIGQWGIKSPFSATANRDSTKDVLVTTVPSVNSPHTFEQFTITFESMGKDLDMILMWDAVMIVVPIKKA